MKMLAGIITIAITLSQGVFAERGGKAVEVKEAKVPKVSVQKPGETKEAFELRKAREEKSGNVTESQEGAAKLQEKFRTPEEIQNGVNEIRGQGAFHDAKPQTAEEQREDKAARIRKAGEPEGGKRPEAKSTKGLTPEESANESRKNSAFMKSEKDITKDTLRPLEDSVKTELFSKAPSLVAGERTRAELAARLMIEEEIQRAANPKKGEASRAPNTKEVIANMKRLVELLESRKGELPEEVREKLLANLLIMYRRAPGSLKSIAEFIENTLDAAKKEGITPEQKELEMKTLRGLNNIAEVYAARFLPTFLAGGNVFDAHTAAMTDWISYAKGKVSYKELEELRKKCLGEAL